MCCPPNGPGCHSKVVSLINDKQFCIKAAKYVRQNGYKKGEPNLTLRQFYKGSRKNKMLRFVNELPQRGCENWDLLINSSAKGCILTDIIEMMLLKPFLL